MNEDALFVIPRVKGLDVVNDIGKSPSGENGSYIVTGQVKNKGKKSAQYDEILAIGYDRNGTPVAVVSGYAKLT